MSENNYNERDFTILSALSQNYSSAYYVDFDKDEIVPYRISDVIEKQSGSYFRTNPKYWDAITSYIERNTAPEDKEEMLKIVSYENLCRELTDKRLFMYDYRVFRNGVTQYYRMKVANVTEGEGLHKAVMGFADISTQKISDIKRYAYVSSVTGGHNYNMFKEEMIKCTAKGYLTAMDIYAFKIVNSACGVKKGDEVLKAAWECILSCIDEEDFAAHINGDHFVIFFAGNEKSLVTSKLAAITAEIEKMSMEMEIPRLSAYFGSAEWEPGDSVEEIYGNATFAKHSIKGKSETNHAFYSKQDSENTLLSKQMEDSFENALSKNEFEIMYQPKYTPSGNQLIGAEALVRWRRDGKLVSPGIFIPVFEKNGMIKRLDEYVFRRVCEQQKKWRDEGCIIIPISVNISRVSLYFQNIVEQYNSILSETGIESKYVPLEITESAAVDNAEIKALTDKFFHSGFTLHMDDFGTGYSSLSTLNQMHFNTLKLDKSIIDYIGNYGGDKLLEHTIALAKDLGLHVTAEGVETKTQVNFLKSLHCDSIQGYYFSKPLPVDEFTECLSKSRFEKNELDIDNDERSSSINDTLYEVIQNALAYSNAKNKHFIYSHFNFNDNVFGNKRAVASLLNVIAEFVIDKTPENESTVMICSAGYANDTSDTICKIAITGVNACIGSTEMEQILQEDDRIIFAQKSILQLGGTMTFDLCEDKDIRFIIRIGFKKE